MDKFTLIGYVELTDQEDKEKITGYCLYFTQPIYSRGSGCAPLCYPGKSFSAIVKPDRFASLDLKVGCQYLAYCTRVKGGAYLVIDSLQLCK